jgi:hypothetical protein
LITQTQRIADEICGILQLWHLVVMRQDYGVPFTFELSQVFCEINPEIYADAYH